MQAAFARLGLGIGARLPGMAPQIALDLLLAQLRRRHPGLFERLAVLEPADVAIDPVDMPAIIVLTVGPTPRLRLVTRGAASAEVEATVRGRFETLLDLAEGRIDGDALFFSRALAVEGRTELVVALRNAIDAAEIDLEADIAAAFGRFAWALPALRRRLAPLVAGIEAACAVARRERDATRTRAGEREAIGHG